MKKRNMGNLIICEMLRDFVLVGEEAKKRKVERKQLSPHWTRIVID